MFSNTNDIKIRKLLINTFVREIILYPEEIIIVYNFTEPIETPKIDKKTTEEIERQSQSALSLRLGSDKLLAGAPYTNITNPRESLRFVLFFNKD